MGWLERFYFNPMATKDSKQCGNEKLTLGELLKPKVFMQIYSKGRVQGKIFPVNQR